MGFAWTLPAKSAKSRRVAKFHTMTLLSKLPEASILPPVPPPGGAGLKATPTTGPVCPVSGDIDRLACCNIPQDNDIIAASPTPASGRRG